MIIDSHVHISIYENIADSLEKALLLLLEEMVNNHINYAIIIPDNVENDPKIAGLNTAIQLTKGKDNLFLLGSPDVIQRGSSEIEKFKELLERGIIKGIKFFPGHDPYYPIDDRCLPYYETCQSLNAPVVFHTGENPDDFKATKYNDPKYIVEIANKFLKLKVVITHYFWPKLEYCYEITKNSPNIYFELAGTADKEVLEKSEGIKKMRKVLNQTIQDRPNQVIFGTDWPMCSIEDHINLIRSLNLSKEIKEKIFSENAIDLYRLPVRLKKSRQ